MSAVESLEQIVGRFSKRFKQLVPGLSSTDANVLMTPDALLVIQARAASVPGQDQSVVKALGSIREASIQTLAFRRASEKLAAVNAKMAEREDGS